MMISRALLLLALAATARAASWPDQACDFTKLNEKLAVREARCVVFL